MSTLEQHSQKPEIIHLSFLIPDALHSACHNQNGIKTMSNVITGYSHTNILLFKRFTEAVRSILHVYNMHMKLDG